MFEKFLLLLLMGIFTGCEKNNNCYSNHEIDIQNWVVTDGILISEKLDGGMCGFKITYDASKSNAFNKEGKKITGPIEQFGIKPKMLVNNQKIKIAYQKSEPVVFKILSDLKYE